jgi:hypothetical protein
VQGEDSEATGGRGGSVGGSVAVFVSLAGVAAALTCLFLGMRSVMQIGGTCASGQTPFVIAHPCPKGTALFMIGGIWGGLVFAGIYAWETVKHHVPSFLGLLWPALFLSLGYNFLTFGIDPPGASSGPVTGWLICAVLFFLMGGLPLLAALPALGRRFTGTPEPSFLERTLPTGGTVRSAISLMSSLRQATKSGMFADLMRQASEAVAAGTATSTTGTATGVGTGTGIGTGVGPTGTDPAASTSGPWSAGAWTAGGTAGFTPAGFIPSGAGEGLVTALERLDKLHRSGALDDGQYEAAKRKIIGTGGAS